jgi:hypothetical protein
LIQFAGGIHADPGQHAPNLAVVAARRLFAPMQAQHPAELIADGQRGIERIDRILKDEADLAPADLAHLGVRQRAQVAPAKHHFT